MERIKFDREANKGSVKTLFSAKAFISLVDGKTLNLKGYFVVFNRLSTDRGGYVAMIPPNSMVLPDYDVVCIYNHNDSHILGRESNGSLAFAEDQDGIGMTVNLADTQFNRDLITQVERGDINGMSFGMYPIKTRTEKRVLTAEEVDPNSGLTALIGKEIEIEIYDKWLLDEITVCGLPAFPQTSLEVFSKKDSEEEGKNNENVEIELMEYEAVLNGLLID